MQSYLSLVTTCDLSEASLLWAAELLPAAKVYTLYVSGVRVIEARQLCRHLAAEAVRNPLSPYINICVDPGYRKYEWALQAGDRSGLAIGSPPVS